MRALGYPVRRFQLIAWIVSAVIAALAGFLLANLTQYASPAYAAWTLSGELIVIVMLGGIGTVIGRRWSGRSCSCSSRSGLRP